MTPLIWVIQIILHELTDIYIVITSLVITSLVTLPVAIPNSEIMM